MLFQVLFYLLSAVKGTAGFAGVAAAASANVRILGGTVTGILSGTRRTCIRNNESMVDARECLLDVRRQIGQKNIIQSEWPTRKKGFSH